MNNEIDIFDYLKNKLIENNEVIEISTIFDNFKDDYNRVDYVYQLLKRYDLLPKKLVIENYIENNIKSKKSRQIGNEYFKIKNYFNALFYYNESIRLQSDKYLYALSLANRSLVLLELNQFQECLKDIEKLLQLNTYPQDKIQKILNRQKKANEALKIKERSILKVHEPLPKKTYGQHPEIECASNCLEIKQDIEFGRHIVSTRLIKPGDVISIESPYVTQQLFEFGNMNCNYCHEFSLNLIPCRQNCSYALFCNEVCESKSWSESHRFECQYLYTAMKFNINEIKLISLKSVIKSITSNFEQSSFKYPSCRFNEINSLIKNTKYRSIGDLFYRATFSAFLYHLLTMTDFFQIYSKINRNSIKSLLLQQSQIVSSNFHQIIQYDRFQYDHFLQIGHAGYSFLSLINHSCYPNVFRIYYGATVVLIADSFIEKGQQIFDSYGYRFASSNLITRRTELQKQYYFQCNCIACEKQWIIDELFPDFYKHFHISRDEFKQIETNADIEKAYAIIKILNKFISINGTENNEELLQQIFLKNLLFICYSVFGNKKIHS